MPHNGREKYRAGAELFPPVDEDASHRSGQNRHCFWLAPDAAALQPAANERIPIGPAYACITGFPVKARSKAACRQR